MAGVQDKALTTPEILETILLHLDLASILTSAQRVCHSWRDLITTSPSLQQHLYFQPNWNQNQNQTLKTPNPLLSTLFPGWFPPPPPANISRATTDKDDEEVEAAVLDEHTFETLALAHADKNRAFMYKHASWRNMLLSQPPIPDLVLFGVCENFGGTVFGGPVLPFGPGAGDSESETDSKPPTVMPDANAEPKPLRMATLYDELVESHGSIPRYWMFLWDTTPQQRMPREFGGYRFSDEERRLVRETVRAYGMVLGEYVVRQCVHPFRWTAGKKFIFHEE